MSGFAGVQLKLLEGVKSWVSRTPLPWMRDIWCVIAWLTCGWFVLKRSHVKRQFILTTIHSSTRDQKTRHVFNRPTFKQIFNVRVRLTRTTVPWFVPYRINFHDWSGTPQDVSPQQLNFSTKYPYIIDIPFLETNRFIPTLSVWHAEVASKEMSVTRISDTAYVITIARVFYF